MSDSKHESDVSFIKALAEMLRSNDLTEIEVRREYGEDDVLDVRVARQMQSAPVMVQTPAAPAPATAAASPAPASAAPAAAAPSDPAQHPGAVPSPMVGTAYLAAEPGKPNFVSVGDKVAEGQTILIIEAMKTMNQIPAPRAGTIKRVLVDDGAPVEFGTPLVIIE